MSIGFVAAGIAKAGGQAALAGLSGLKDPRQLAALGVRTFVMNAAAVAFPVLAIGIALVERFAKHGDTPDERAIDLMGICGWTPGEIWAVICYANANGIPRDKAVGLAMREAVAGWYERKYGEKPRIGTTGFIDYAYQQRHGLKAGGGWWSMDGPSGELGAVKRAAYEADAAWVAKRARRGWLRTKSPFGVSIKKGERLRWCRIVFKVSQMSAGREGSNITRDGRDLDAIPPEELREAERVLLEVGPHPGKAREHWARTGEVLTGKRTLRRLPTGAREVAAAARVARSEARTTRTADRSRRSRWSGLRLGRASEASAAQAVGRAAPALPKRTDTSHAPSSGGLLDAIASMVSGVVSALAGLFKR